MRVFPASAAIVSLVCGSATHAQTVDESWPELFRMRPPTAMTVDETNGRLYIAAQGHFGVRHEHGVSLDPISGTISQTMPVPDHGVVATVADGTGGWYVGGEFEHVGGLVRNHIAHVSATGEVLPWSLDVNGTVKDLLITNDTLILVGEFTTVAGITRNRIAAVHLPSNTVLPWDPNAGSTVFTVEVAGSRIHVGGVFSQMSGQARTYLARFDRTTGALLGAVNTDGPVHDIEAYGDKVYVGGSFSDFGPYQRFCLGALDMTGNATTWQGPSAVVGGVRSILAEGDTLYLGGDFDEHAAACDRITGTLLPWDPGCDEEVLDLMRVGSTIYMAGRFTHVGGQWRTRMAAVDAVSAALRPWDPSSTGDVATICWSDGQVYAGGWFLSVNGFYSPGVTALDLATGQPTGWSVEIAGGVTTQVKEMAVTQDAVCIVGDFDSVQGQPRTCIAVLDRQSANLLPYTVNVDRAETVAELNGDMYVGGWFSDVNGSITRNNLLAFDAATGALLPWAPSTGIHTVNTLRHYEGRVYFGGFFNTVNGQTRRLIAAVDAVTGTLEPWAPNVISGRVDELAVYDGVVYFAGSFETVNAQDRDGQAAVLASANILTPWSPPFDNQFVVASILPHEGDLYVGANDGLPLVALDTLNGDVLPWDGITTYAGTSGNSIIAKSATHMFVAGPLTDIFGSPRDAFAATGISIPTGVDQAIPTEQHALSVFPTPTMGGDVELRIPTCAQGHVLVQLLDSRGQLVLSTRTYAANGSLRYALHVPEGCAEGLYVVKVVSADGVHSTRLVVRR